MLGKFMLCILTGAALPVMAQTAVSNENAAPQNTANTSTVQSNEEKPAATAQKQEMDDFSLAKEALKTGKDARIEAALKAKYAKDINLTPYETKLIHRQMTENDTTQKEKEQALKTLSDAFKYNEEQLQQAEKLYDSGNKPVNYQLSKSTEFSKQADENYADALYSLASSGRINKEYIPQVMNNTTADSAAIEVENQTVQASVSPAQQPQKAKPSRPIQSIQSLKGAQTASKPKRLGVKSYNINPDNFY